jgi:hypothetical protein
MTTDDQAPLFGSWRKAYCITLGVFALEIGLLYAFTVLFS